MQKRTIDRYRWMQSPLEHTIAHSHKMQATYCLNAHPEDFEELIRLALSDKQPYSWHAASLLMLHIATFGNFT